MASNEMHIVAVFKAKADKADEVEKALTESVAKIHEKEPGTLRFYVLKPKKSNDFIIIEKYKDMNALKAHGSTDYFKAMGAKVKPYLEAPPEVKFCNFVTGFEGRPVKL